MELMRRRYGIMGLNGGAGIPVIEATATGNPMSFVTDIARPLKSLVVPFDPVQDTSGGDPSPDHICPISGWSGCEISNGLGSFYNNSNITYGAVGTTIKILAADAINVKATSANYPSSKQLLSNYQLVNGKTYIISADVEINSGVGRIAVRNSSNGVVVSSGRITDSGRYYLIFTYDSSRMNYLSFFCNYSSSSAGDVTYNNIRFEEANTLSISWQSVAGMRDGGVLTVNDDGSGVLVVDRLSHIINDLTTSNIKKSSNSSIKAGRAGYYISNPYYLGTYCKRPGGDGNTNHIRIDSDKLLIGTRSALDVVSSETFAVGIGVSSSDASLWFNVSATDFPNISSFVSYMNNLAPTIVFPRKTNLTFNLSNLQVTTLIKGENIIWSDTNGTNTATYLKHQS